MCSYKFQWCFKGVSSKFSWWVSEVSSMFQGCDMSISRVFLEKIKMGVCNLFQTSFKGFWGWSFRGVSWKFKGCVKSVSMVTQWNLMKISKMFQKGLKVFLDFLKAALLKKCFKEVPRCFMGFSMVGNIYWSTKTPKWLFSWAEPLCHFFANQ